MKSYVGKCFWIICHYVIDIQYLIFQKPPEAFHSSGSFHSATNVIAWRFPMACYRRRPRCFYSKIFFMFTKTVKKIFYSYIDLHTHHWNIPQTLIVKLLFSDVEWSFPELHVPLQHHVLPKENKGRISTVGFHCL